MKKHLTVLVSALVAIGMALAPPASAAQGGYDRDHWWAKIAAWELRNQSVDFVCKNTFALMNGPGCSHLIVPLSQQHLAHPNANGYWAEWYPATNQTRSGTW